MKEILNRIIERIDQDIKDYEREQKQDRMDGFDDEAIMVGKIITGLHIARKYCTEERVKLKNL